MNTPVTINNQTLPIREYKGQRVVTFKDIDAVHDRPDGTAGRNFRKNRKHFIENTDFFTINLTSDEIRRQFGAGKNAGRTITALAESGYLMLAKSFTDDLAWQVQRELVNCYFRSKTVQAEPEQITLELSEEYHLIPKTFKGTPVFSSVDIENFSHISRSTFGWHLKTHCTFNKDYFHLIGSALADYKRENPGEKKSSSNIIVVAESGIKKLNKKYGSNIPLPSVALSESKIALSESSAPAVETTATNERPAAPTLPHKQNDYTIAIAVLGEIRRRLVQSGNGEGAESVNAAINYTAWELSRNMMEGNI